MGTDPRSLLDGYVRVSTAPLILSRISSAINSPRTSIGYISSIISEDSGLTARLLKVVNSAFFGFPSNIDTISRAVIVVGMEQLHDLALATSAVSLFRGISEKFVTMSSFWRHSIGCGVAARVLASLCREQNIERFFVGGVLHDIGRLVMFDRIPDAYEEVFEEAKRSGELLFHVERRQLGFDHSSVGRLLLQSWKLPNTLEEIVGCHHGPDQSGRYPVETSIIHTADIIAHAMGLGSSGERSLPPLQPQAWAQLGLAPGLLAHIVETVDRQYTDAVHLVSPSEET